MVYYYITMYRFLKRSNSFQCPGRTSEGEECTVKFTPETFRRFQISVVNADIANEEEAENGAEAMEGPENESLAENENNTPVQMNSTLNPFSQDLFDDVEMAEDD
jgi:hypothetical protein